MNSHRLLILSVFMGLTFASLFGAPPKNPRNEKLLAALEPMESLSEVALDGTASKIAKSLNTAEGERRKIRPLLSAEAAARLDALFADIHAAQKKQDSVATAIAAAEIYKVVAAALDPAALAVPQEVSLLDYVGFRTKALLKAPSPDWTALAKTAQESNDYWAKIRARVTNKKLQSAMDKAQHDLASAAETKSASLCTAATRANLDLVDDLESFFSK